MSNEKITSFISSLNPLNFLSEMYSATLDYKTRIKELDNENEMNKLRANEKILTIHSNHSLRMEKLHHERLVLENFFNMLSKELESVRFGREEVMLMAQNAQKKSFEKGLSIEERKFYSKQAISLVSQFRILNVSGAQLLNSVKQSLAIGDSSKLLIEGR